MENKDFRLEPAHRTADLQLTRDRISPETPLTRVGVCVVCGKQTGGGFRRLYCSDGCKQHAADARRIAQRVRREVLGLED